MDRAVHIGLIVNELATNALKHGFPEGGAGEVVVRAQPDGEQITLQVRDNGKGLPADLDLAQAPSLGLRIVEILARRLGGRVTATNDGGAAFAITFPIRDDPAIEPRLE